MSHLFLVDNLIDNADISYLTGDELAQFPLANIQDQFTTKIAKVESNSVDILVDTKVLTEKNIIMLVGSFVDGLGFTSLSLYSSSTTDFSGSTEVPVTVSGEYNMAYVQFTSTNNRYFKLSFTGTGSTTSISNIFLGEAETINDKCLSSEGFKISNNDRSDISVNKYGNRFSTNYPIAKNITGSFSVIDNDERKIIQQIIKDKGLTTPFFVILDKDSFQGDESNYELAGYFFFESLPEFASLNVKYYTTTISLTQAG